MKVGEVKGGIFIKVSKPRVLAQSWLVCPDSRGHGLCSTMGAAREYASRSSAQRALKSVQATFPTNTVEVVDALEACMVERTSDTMINKVAVWTVRHEMGDTRRVITWVNEALPVLDRGEKAMGRAVWATTRTVWQQTTSGPHGWIFTDRSTAYCVEMLDRGELELIEEVDFSGDVSGEGGAVE